MKTRKNPTEQAPKKGVQIKPNVLAPDMYKTKNI